MQQEKPGQGIGRRFDLFGPASQKMYQNADNKAKRQAVTG